MYWALQQSLALYWLIVAVCFVNSIARASSHGYESIQQDLGQMPLDKLVDPANPAIINVEQVLYHQETSRHKEAKTTLLGKLDRKYGNWDSHHPRYRLLDALWGFLRYHERQKVELERIKKLYKNVSKDQRSLLEKHVHYSSMFQRIDNLLSKNQVLCSRIVDKALEFYGIDEKELQKHISTAEKGGRTVDKVSVSQALKHVVRDWTESGSVERDGPFSCIIAALNRLIPTQAYGSSDATKILLPGAGLGRLGFELARRLDFEVTINEWSMYMNVVYRYLESSQGSKFEAFTPFIDGWSHHATEVDMNRKLLFPDVTVNTSSVVMIEGDFTTAFDDDAERYDVVATYFFIDTARNLMSYFDTIKSVLKPGGYWINLGPLLYGTGPFVQLTLEDIAIVTEAMGFNFLDAPESCGSITIPGRKFRGQEAIYAFDERALTKSAYKAQFWVAQKSDK